MKGKSVEIIIFVMILLLAGVVVTMLIYETTSKKEETQETTTTTTITTTQKEENRILALKSYEDFIRYSTKDSKLIVNKDDFKQINLKIYDNCNANNGDTVKLNSNKNEVTYNCIKSDLDDGEGLWDATGDINGVNIIDYNYSTCGGDQEYYTNGSYYIRAQKNGCSIESMNESIAIYGPDGYNKELTVANPVPYKGDYASGVPVLYKNVLYYITIGDKLSDTTQECLINYIDFTNNAEPTTLSTFTCDILEE